MRLFFGGLVARMGNQGALTNARSEIEDNRMTKARIDAVARRLRDPKAGGRRRSGAA